MEMSQLPRRRRRRETTDQQPAVRRANGRTWWVYFSSYQLNRTEKTHEQTNFRGRATGGEWSLSRDNQRGRVAMIRLSITYSINGRGKTLSRVKCRQKTFSGCRPLNHLSETESHYSPTDGRLIRERGTRTETIANEVAGNRSNDKRN